MEHGELSALLEVLRADWTDPSQGYVNAELRRLTERYDRATLMAMEEYARQYYPPDSWDARIIEERLRLLHEGPPRTHEQEGA